MPFVFELKASTGSGGGGAIRESTGRNLGFHQGAQSDSAKRGGDLRSRPGLWKDRRLVVSGSAALPPLPGGRWEKFEFPVFFEK